MNRPLTLALALALGLSVFLALILRLPNLDQRPFHNDEAVNAVKFRDLLTRGRYAYDPEEFHGPALHYATLFLARVTGWQRFEDTTEASFRWLTVLVGVGMIPALILVRDALGRAGTAWAAVCLALSPSLVFFSRDYIHEILLVASTLLLLASVWRYARRPGWGWAVGVGGCLGLMHATKETFVLNLVAMGSGYALLRLTEGSPGFGSAPQSVGLRAAAGQTAGARPRAVHALVGLAAWGGVWALLFSSFGRNPAGLWDSIRTYGPWLSRAGGESAHLHPWWFFVERLLWHSSGGWAPWTELGLLGLALVGVGAAFARRGLGEASGAFVRWLGLYGALLFALYSAIPYKTPWCILGVALVMTLLAGVGLAVLWGGVDRMPRRVGVAALTLCLLGHGAWQAWTLSHSPVATRQNPWAYGDTAPDIRNLTALIQQLTTADPAGLNLNIQVVCEQDDYWPLPYELRRFTRVGWWSELPPAPRAPVLVVSPRWAPHLDTDSAYVNAGAFQLRRGVFRACYVERGLWADFLGSRGSN
ncbi:MAG: TIGR03663 family protein [Verrucomicrobia bacterium]|jgi:uncharacterized protein (TIGR03663 family)|nr:TIGR03663 family protein [Verrucomicrobiota bacterium]